jgi:polysaccharide export outer membrane protein
MFVPHFPEFSGTPITKALALALIVSLGACNTLGSSGPSSRAISGSSNRTVSDANIKIIEVTDQVTRRVMAASAANSFAQVFGDVPPGSSIVGTGDVLAVTIWEAPPAALFGGNSTFGTTSAGEILSSSAQPPRETGIPPMMVDSEGFIRVPFAGSIRAAGRTPQQIEREIASRLAGKAHDPQVFVNLATNANDMVTVVGDFGSNTRVNLTPRGERLLDVIATAGGVNQAVGKITVQITRGDRIAAQPLEAVIRDPKQNITLQADDIVTAYYQPFSFTSLGATGSNAEIPFESTGLSLAQALGRIGGLREDRANAKGVFIFRLENPAALDPAIAANARMTPDGRIPVIYRVDLSNPATFFNAQKFPIRNEDVLYVSNAPLTDLQKFVGIVSSLTFTVIGLGQAFPDLGSSGK